jgi:preprotein translocase subunit SecA
VETYHFDIRKNVLEYDDVMNVQREKFYSQRKRVLNQDNLSEDILFMMDRELDRLMKSYITPEQNPEEYVPDDLSAMIRELISICPQIDFISVDDIKDKRYSDIYDKLKELMSRAYQKHETEIITFYNDIMEQYEQDFVPQELFSENNMMRSLERDVLLRVVDNKWIDHLHNIDMLREGIGLRAYGQKDPLIEYKREAYDLYNTMMHEVQAETVRYLFRTKFGVQFVGNETV